ncbi:hypothetical protein FACS18949_18280 [Clostridia bacterium]|nr:hypothetical protein FACS18949_18280 [Clostridia bacterium]
MNTTLIFLSLLAVLLIAAIMYVLAKRRAVVSLDDDLDTFGKILERVKQVMVAEDSGELAAYLSGEEFERAYRRKAKFHRNLTDCAHGIEDAKIVIIDMIRELIAQEVTPEVVDADVFAVHDELSHLSQREQAVVVDCMAQYDCKPSLSQAVRIKKMKQAGTLTEEIISSVLAEDKKPQKSEAHGSARFRRYFPPEYSPKQIETVIIGLLKEWKPGVATL